MSASPNVHSDGFVSRLLKQVDELQARGTELVEENRSLRAELKALAGLASDEEVIRIGLNKLCEVAHSAAVSRGFYDGAEKTQVAMLARVALTVSEHAESVEELRRHWPDTSMRFENGKPEGYVVEEADAVIRTADACGWVGEKLGDAVVAKLRFNASRPYRHGKSGL